MSQNLYYSPPAKRISLPDALKYAIRDRRFSSSEPTSVDASDIQYFEGLADAGIDGAREVIEAIEKYNSITLYLAE